MSGEGIPRSGIPPLVPVRTLEVDLGRIERVPLIPDPVDGDEPLREFLRAVRDRVGEREVRLTTGDGIRLRIDSLDLTVVVGEAALRESLRDVPGDATPAQVLAALDRELANREAEEVARASAILTSDVEAEVDVRMARADLRRFHPLTLAGPDAEAPLIRIDLAPPASGPEVELTFRGRAVTPTALELAVLARLEELRLTALESRSRLVKAA